jgi:hypothetical protein
MYLDAGSGFALVMLALAAFAGWLWNDSLQARERMLDTCARLCRELKVQFLDESVALVRLRLGWGAGGRPELVRVYVFEFSGTGQDRWQGRATLAGRRVVSVQLDHPEGVTILGAGAPVSPELLRLTQSRNDERLH